MKYSMFVALYMALALISIGVAAEETPPTELSNGSFESGDLTGWTAIGDSFSEDAVTSDEFFWGNREFFHEGEYHLFGFPHGDGETGELRSEVFRLDGTGYISFLIGAGADPDKTYVSIVDAERDFQLKRVHNHYFDGEDFTNNYGRVLLDMTDYLGRDLYIRVVDRNDTDEAFNFINVDDFDVNYDPDDFETTPAPDYTHSVEKANEFIEERKGDVDDRWLPTYHFTAPYGWINDPNGFSYFDGEAHLFYQHNPYTAYWAGMHWGHATTEDFISWEHQPVAIAPDEDYDYGGIYSGGAMEVNGMLYAMYTAILPRENDLPAFQQQAVAVSEDGINFEKLEENPVIDVDMYDPDIMDTIDVRDPNVFEHDGTYYAIIGNHHHHRGQIVMYESEDFVDWSFTSVLVSASDIDPDNPERFGINWECPDLFYIDGEWVMIISPQMMPSDGPRYTNLHSAIYLIGDVDFDTGRMDVRTYGEIDSGHDFYAPQSLSMPDGRRVMTAWMQDWGTVDEIFTAEYGHNWAGMMTIPREIRIEGDRLYTYPVEELAGYRENHVQYTFETFRGFKSFDGIEGQVADMEFTLDPGDAENFGVRLFEDDEHFTLIRYDIEGERLIIDREHSGEDVYSTTRREVHVPLNDDGNLDLRILLDNSALEVFANGGEASIASRVYPSEEANGITFFSDDAVTFENLQLWDIVVE